jgi:hypothetical protein
VDPFTGTFLAILLLMWAVKRTFVDSAIDFTYARQGKVSPRLEAKYGKEAPQFTAGYGFLDYVGDAWRDHWQRKNAALAADREEYMKNPGPRVRLRDRVARAKQNMATAYRTVVDPRPAKDATPDRAEDAAEPAVTPLVESGDVPPGTVRITDTGREQWDGARWVPAPEPEPTTTPPAAAAEPVGRPARTVSADPNPNHSGGPAMTGEAANHETTVATLEALAADQRTELEAAIAAEQALEQAATAIDTMQQTYQQSSDTARSVHDQLTGLHLDQETLALTGTAADALPAGVVNTMYDELEAMKAKAAERKRDAEIALKSTEALLAHLVAEYGEEHAKVAANLSGDPTYLGSGGGGGDSALPQGEVDRFHSLSGPPGILDTHHPRYSEHYEADGTPKGREPAGQGSRAR